MTHLEFPLGLPAFENQTRFRLVESEARAPLLFLESEADPNLSFLLLPVALVDRDYQLSLSESDRAALNLVTTVAAPEELVCLTVITANENLPPTANLLAPIVVNPANLRAVQAVRADSRYSHQHPLVSTEPVCS